MSSLSKKTPFPLHRETEDQTSSSPERKTRATGSTEEPVKKEKDDDGATSVRAVNVSGLDTTKSCKREGKSKDIHGIKTSLQVLPVRVCDENGGSIDTYALLDTGSEESFLTRPLADKLKLKETNFDTLTICTLTGESTVNVGKTDVMVEPLENPGGRRILIQNIRIVEKLNIKPFKPKDLSKWPHLEGIEIPEIDEEEVTILIGANVPEVQVHEESRTGRAGELYAVRTILGWAILGPVGTGTNAQPRKTNVHSMRYGDEKLD